MKKQYDLADGELTLEKSEQKIGDDPGLYYKFTISDVKGKICKFKVQVHEKKIIWYDFFDFYAYQLFFKNV